MRNTALLVAGSKSAARLTAVEMESRAGESRAKISTARADGSMLRPVRTNSGSSKRVRSRARAALMAGWPRKSFSAARVTLRSCMSVSNTISRLRSTLRRSFLFMQGYFRNECVKMRLCSAVVKAHIIRVYDNY